jgi:hypothetical protein
MPGVVVLVGHSTKRRQLGSNYNFFFFKPYEQTPGAVQKFIQLPENYVFFRKLASFTGIFPIPRWWSMRTKEVERQVDVFLSGCANLFAVLVTTIRVGTMNTCVRARFEAL